MGPVSMRSAGWVWEGQGLDPGVHPSVFGVGEGAAYFGLSRAHHMFHPNDALAMNKLSGLDEVVCDISKWRFRDTEGGGSACYGDATFETVLAEAANVGRLSLDYPNVTGAIHDDMKGLVEREGIAADQYAEIHAALRRENPDLKLWAVVYTHELDAPTWAAFLPYIDVVNLWVWNASDLHTLDDGLARCVAVFAPRPIVIGCYLRDYPTQAPVPMDRVRYQWEWIAASLAEGKIAGYAILGTVLIDGQQEQAGWIREFIGRH